MTHTPSPSPRPIFSAISWLRSAAVFIILGLLFALTYTQAPTFTSNQYQYFLHGLAQAGLGSLPHDWLANTQDPTPVFSALVQGAYQLTHGFAIFPISYALLMGLYLYSLMGILDVLFNLRRSRLFFASVLIFIFLIHSAALRYLLMHLVGPTWAFLFDGGLAGQRMLGLVFQPSAFGVLLLFALFLFMRGKTTPACAAAALAAVVHPTYLFASGLVVAALLLIELLETRRLKTPLLAGLLALVMVAPILSYVFSSFGGSSEEIAEARHILVAYSVPHHAVVSAWFDATSLIKLGLLVGVLVYLYRRNRRLFGALAVISGVSLLLSLAQLAIKSDLLALIFPWRISILLIPAASAVLLGAATEGLFNRCAASLEQHARPLLWGCAAVLVLLAASGVYRMQLDAARRAADPARAMLSFVRDNSRPEDVYLTPVKMEEFRLETLQPIYVDQMATPYSDREVIAWHHRNLSTQYFFNNRACKKVIDFVGDGGVTRIVFPRSEGELECAKLTEIYSDTNYVVYQIK